MSLQNSMDVFLDIVKTLKNSNENNTAKKAETIDDLNKIISKRRAELQNSAKSEENV